ncbi:MAG: hypothetical protein U5L96_09635 [Owenweeksia sp.]|nr:hypothetical protein [Owenweeksia sp.]
MKVIKMTICPLCMNRDGFAPVTGPQYRAYLLCPNCKLIFTDTRIKASKKDENKRYNQQKKGTASTYYVKFLNKAIKPALPHLNHEMTGLDYVSGPTPALSELMDRNGLRCESYDPVYFPELPEKTYDFIFCTDVFEHLSCRPKNLKRSTACSSREVS